MTDTIDLAIKIYGGVVTGDMDVQEIDSELMYLIADLEAKLKRNKCSHFCDVIRKEAIEETKAKCIEAILKEVTI